MIISILGAVLNFAVRHTITVNVLESSIGLTSPIDHQTRQQIW